MINGSDGRSAHHTSISADVNNSSLVTESYNELVTDMTSLNMIFVMSLPFALMGPVSGASGGMECLRNKDCATKHEHLCNMQSGLWTKNYILTAGNSSYNEVLESCACCFLPDVYRIKVAQRGLFDTVMALESEVQSFMNRVKPCAPLRRACSKTSDCCTGYCSASEHHDGFCNDPLVLRDSQEILKSLNTDISITTKKRIHPLYSDLSSSPSTETKVGALETKDRLMGENRSISVV